MNKNKKVVIPYSVLYVALQERYMVTDELEHIFFNTWFSGTFSKY